MDTIKTVRDRLNAIKSKLQVLTQPKMGKSWFDNQKIFELEQEIKVLEEKMKLMKKEESFRRKTCGIKKQFITLQKN